MSGDTQWDRWQAAISDAKRIETERGNPASGYYKRNASDGRVEAICIYRDDAGALQCVRNVYGDGSRMTADEIDELFGSCCIYPIGYDDYLALDAGTAGPEFATRLTMAEQEAGVAWTPALGRKKLGAATLLVENERAVIGDNSQHAAQHDLLVARINDLADTRRSWLREIGGAIDTQEHADRAADFKTAFAALEKEAVDTHRSEKAPHLEAGREIDKRWKPIGELAERCKRETAAMVASFLKAQAEAAREAAARAAADARSRQEGAAAPVEPVKARAGHSGRGVTLRSVTKGIITDLPALAAHLAAMNNPPPDFAQVCRTLAEKLLKAGCAVPGAKLETTEIAA